MGRVRCESAEPNLRRGRLACRVATIAHSIVEMQWWGVLSIAAADARSHVLLVFCVCNTAEEGGAECAMEPVLHGSTGGNAGMAAGGPCGRRSRKG
eukprot:12889149-Prorocentrum_lima.AAC.1